MIKNSIKLIIKLILILLTKTIITESISKRIIIMFKITTLLTIVIIRIKTKILVKLLIFITKIKIRIIKLKIIITLETAI